jgi:hypothetical protein
MFIKVENNPTGGEDNQEAKWWKNWLGRKKEVHTRNSEHITELRKQQLHLQVQQQTTHMELQTLCAKYDLLVKQLAAEERVGHKSEHRRLEVDDKKPSV